MILVDAATIYKFFAWFFLFWTYFFIAISAVQKKRAQIAEARVQELEKGTPDAK